MKEYTIRIISARDITRCIDMQESITAMAEAFRAVSAGEAVMPVRTSLAVDDHGVALFMPAYLPGCGQISLKTVMAFQDNPRRGLPAIHALVQLFNAATGQPLALIDGEQLTALRTGAASGLATQLLAADSAESVAVIGAGVQGRTQLEAVCCVRKIKRAYVIDLSREAMELFAREMSSRLSLEVLPATVDILGEVEIICTATASRTPLFSHALLKPGVHINAIGAFRPEMCEIPPETVKQARVFVDQRAACLQEAGDLIQPLAAGLIDESHIRRELGELLVDAGSAKGRQNDEEITLFKSVGIAAQDLVVASLIYARASEGNIGTEVQL
jgi:ornithine cyclodeaminase/alanine dehydrogenase-like protein (mu-crystallin family)